MLPIIFLMPVIQLLILAYAATYDLKKINTWVVGLDQSSTSRELLGKFKGSSFFEVKNYTFDYQSGELAMDAGKVDLIIQIPCNFDRDLSTEKVASVGLSINAINSASAGLINAYTTAIVRDYNKNLITKRQV